MVASIENAENNRCVDLFRRPDGTYGFEEFRRDVEDRTWIPVKYFSWETFPSRLAALDAANQKVVWLPEMPTGYLR